MDRPEDWQEFPKIDGNRPEASPTASLWRSGRVEHTFALVVRAEITPVDRSKMDSMGRSRVWSKGVQQHLIVVGPDLDCATNKEIKMKTVAQNLG